jgi:hypothetical protein
MFEIYISKRCGISGSFLRPIGHFSRVKVPFPQLGNFIVGRCYE